MTIFAFALFCDDVRNEVGGKQSFIGVYKETLKRRSSTPFDIPKLNAVLWFWVEQINQLFNADLEIVMPDGHIERRSVKELVPLDQINDFGESNNHHRKNEINVIITMSPLRINQEGDITIRIRCDGELYNAASLTVEASEKDRA